MRRYERKALPSVFIPSLFFLYIYIHKTRSQSRPERHSASVGLAVRTRRPPSLSPKHSRGAILRVVSRVPLLCSNILCDPRVCCGFSRLWCESRKLFNDFESIFINKKQNVFKEIEERSSSRLGIIMFLFFCLQLNSILSPTEEDLDDAMFGKTTRHRPEELKSLERSTKFTRKEIQLIYRGFKQVRYTIARYLWRNSAESFPIVVFYWCGRTGSLDSTTCIARRHLRL